MPVKMIFFSVLGDLLLQISPHKIILFIYFNKNILREIASDMREIVLKQAFILAGIIVCYSYRKDGEIFYI